MSPSAIDIMHQEQTLNININDEFDVNLFQSLSLDESPSLSQESTYSSMQSALSLSQVKSDLEDTQMTDFTPSNYYNLNLKHYTLDFNTIATRANSNIPPIAGKPIKSILRGSVGVGKKKMVKIGGLGGQKKLGQSAGKCVRFAEEITKKKSRGGRKDKKKALRKSRMSYKFIDKADGIDGYEADVEVEVSRVRRVR